jgi:hypothetical protein
MFREGLRPPDPFREPEPFQAAKTQDGMSLRAVSDLSAVLVICLPPLGGMFCRKMLHNLAAQRDEIERAGVRLALVHTGRDEDAVTELEPFDLEYVSRIADPEGSLHKAFELGRATMAQRWGPKVWGRAIRAGLQGRGRVVGERRQLPGAFLLKGGRIERAYRAGTMADAPDFKELSGLT